jgi:hypothetical protein
MLIKPGTKVSLKHIDPDDTGGYQNDDKAGAELRDQVA